LLKSNLDRSCFLSAQLVFVYRLAQKLNYQLSMDMAIDAFVDAGFENITVIDFYNQRRLKSDNNINLVNEKSEFLSSLDESDFVFCGFCQDISLVAELIKKGTKTQIINVWHGMPIRHIGLLDNLEKDWQAISTIINNNYRIHHLTASPFYSKLFSASFLAPPSNVHEIGNIRGKTENLRLTQYPELTKYKLVVFYTPTSDPWVKSPFLNKKLCFDFLDHDFDNLLGKENTCFIVKQHPLETKLNLPEFLNIHSFEAVFGSATVQEAFHFADILVTDLSSIAIDFCEYGKPIILVKPSEKYLSVRDSVIPQREFYCHSPNNFEEFCEAIFVKDKQCKYDSLQILQSLLKGRAVGPAANKLIATMQGIFEKNVA